MANISYVQVTSLGSATTLTIPAGARGAHIQAESQNVRYRLDGTSPTASVGMILYAGDPPTVLTDFAGLNAAKFIEVTGSAKLNVHYFN
jgi:hypothetical protein